MQKLLIQILQPHAVDVVQWTVAYMFDGLLFPLHGSFGEISLSGIITQLDQQK